MINSDNNPFLSTGQQQSDPMAKSWEKFAKTNAEINAQDIDDSKKKELLQHEIQSSDFAEQAHLGHETKSSYLDP